MKNTWLSELRKTSMCSTSSCPPMKWRFVSMASKKYFDFFFVSFVYYCTLMYWFRGNGRSNLLNFSYIEDFLLRRLTASTATVASLCRCWTESQGMPLTRTTPSTSSSRQADLYVCIVESVWFFKWKTIRSNEVKFQSLRRGRYGRSELKNSFPH